MPHIRPATPIDLLSIAVTRRRQRVLRLNPPYALVHSEGLGYDSLRSQLPFRSPANVIYVCRERGVVVGYVQVWRRWRRRDEWVITTLGSAEREPEHAWELLLEEVCRVAGEEGVTRLTVKLPQDETHFDLFRGLGFTRYTNERIWGNLYFAVSGTDSGEPPRKSLRRQTNRDAWDIMQLYSATTPPAVQRAEVLNSRYWQVNTLPRLPLLAQALAQGLMEASYAWPDESGQRAGLGGHIRLLTGKRGHWITIMFRPDPANRDMVACALDYVLWKATRHGPKPLYCGLREYQAEAQGLLQDRGFHPLSEQALLVKYLAEPIREKQPALAPLLARVPNTGDLVTSDA